MVFSPYVRDLDDQGCSGDLPHLCQHAQCASAVREPNLRQGTDADTPALCFALSMYIWVCPNL